MSDFEKNSYAAHAEHLKMADRYPPGKAPWEGLLRKGSVNYWRHRRFYALLEPFLGGDDSWLTVGDGWGWDANFLHSAQKRVHASDLSTDTLRDIHARGLIGAFSAQNAEQLDFDAQSFDYVLIKEAFHHFPRPHLAVYELLRVARRAVIFIEPQDPLLKSPLLLALKNTLDRISPDAINRIWKNRYSFETTGNYVYKISDREMEKIAMGIGLPAVAFRGLHDYHLDTPGAYVDPPDPAVFRRVRRVLRWRTLLSRLGLMPYSQLCCVLFKTPPDPAVRAALLERGFQLPTLARNPYAP